MHTTSFFQALLLSAALIPNTFAQSDIADPTTRSEFALSALQIWYNAATGLWDTTGWWNSANVMTMVANLAKIDADNAQLQDLASRIFANTLTQAPAQNPQPGVEDDAVARRSTSNETHSLFNSTGKESGYVKALSADFEPTSTMPKDWAKNAGAYVDVKSLPIFQAQQDVTTAAANPDEWLDGFYDDDLWWALGWIRAYDVTGNTEYLTLAEGIFKAVTKVWPTSCGNGGIWWSWKKEYANAIANELFLSTAAHLANRAQDKEYYIDWAEKELNWFLGTGMINERGTINDGLNDQCQNNNMTTWSYNQGVILGGLVELNKASPNNTYLPLATRIAKAAIMELSDTSGIIHDACGPTCGPDASQFKGIFARNLMQLHEAAPDDAFVETIQVNANSIWMNDRDEGDRISINWAGPFIAPANASTHSSGMDALVAAIVVK
ncbi:glycoside hydrolase family 76 protein [Lentithecium fluviatile CBS 122367]|uniref:Glycoside hydrolase family 76 protein n=1 Tax=Lentithecium fluviatile CBS 122367 TaxID=1168545 RepID=A0A6G1J8P6_9PLEO|nr:glycoside hydrolase family 76 protein [Lentithecium fluviatile CBS 122367]